MRMMNALTPPRSRSDYHNCWATDGAHKKNAAGAYEYFFYMSIGTCQVAVMKSVTTPAGPWANVLGVPLLNASFGDSLNPKACFRDPAVFEDDDGSYYLISGVFDYYIMRLGDDLVSLAEEPRLVTVINPTGPYGAKTDDKPFIHKAGGVYYLSWGCFYGISSSVYGPYTYTGSAIDTALIAPPFRTNHTDGPWYNHEDYADRHGSFWHNAAGQWFYASNDRSHSSDTAHTSVFRDTVVGYVHYFTNASIAPVAIDGMGVGEYDGARIIEAENFMALEGAAAKLHLPSRGDAFVVAVSSSTASLSYPHVLRVGQQLELLAANSGSNGVTVTARRGTPTGPALATCIVAPTGGAFASFSCPMALMNGDDGVDGVDVVLTFAGEGTIRIQLDAFTFGGVNDAAHDGDW